MASKEIQKFVKLGIFFILLSVVIGAIIESPLNEATSVGGQSVFNCSSDTTGALTWLYAADCSIAGGDALTDSNCNIISSYASHYTTEKPGGFVCNLMVFDALLSLGGCYVCADGFGTGRILQAMLIVVDSNATVTSNSTDLVSGEDVMISTSVSYRGPSIPQQPPLLPPSFYWTLQSDPNHNTTSYPGGSTINTSASSYIVETAPKPVIPSYLCNLFFNPPLVVPTSCASNAPTYRTSWVTPTYSVSYPPENINISGNPDLLCSYKTTELSCSASGYPTPTYKWVDQENGSVLSETNNVTIERGGSYQCIASNSFRNFTYNVSDVAKIDKCDISMGVNLRVFVPNWIAVAILTVSYLNLHWMCGILPVIKVN